MLLYFLPAMMSWRETVDDAANHDQVEAAFRCFVERFRAARAHLQGIGGQRLHVHRRAAQEHQLAVQPLLFEKALFDRDP